MHPHQRFCAALVLLLTFGGCGSGTPDNENENAGDSPTRDFSDFAQLFTYSAGPANCAEVGRVFTAQIALSFDQYILGMTILDQSEPFESTALASRVLSDAEVRSVLGVFESIELGSDEDITCIAPGCEDLYSWDDGADSSFTSELCSPPPRISALQAEAIQALLESLRND